MEQEKYTQRVLNTLQSAQQNAALRYHQEITSLHVLMALAQEPEGLLGTIFQEAGVDSRMLQASVEEHLKKIPSVKGQDRLTMSIELGRVMAKAEQLAGKLVERLGRHLQERREERDAGCVAGIDDVCRAGHTGR